MHTPSLPGLPLTSHSPSIMLTHNTHLLHASCDLGLMGIIVHQIIDVHSAAEAGVKKMKSRQGKKIEFMDWKSRDRLEKANFFSFLLFSGLRSSNSTPSYL